ncbi:hypothetical protein [Reinekea marinisedimentorum]|uniref:Uncharacterized protein n=1 Tax=Reinekea marinisedimentorum TaxID=230495 RepID=A0A4R3I963_9GAMM|nr:hypothetical protein [Reinekea marinisedimentorum]TCS41912.1 hypothetical protein BCF53_10416 [Reinekea marinisedimentorum]
MSDTNERIPRDFYQRDPEEQQAFLENTWCNKCQQVDLGMQDPIEYEFMGRIFIEGKCNVCGEPSITEVVEDEEGTD